MSFIKENDEHRDIVNGVQVIDDSISNGILDTNEDAPRIAQEETEFSEAREQSVVHQHLSAALKQIKKDIRDYKQPACYRRGHFFIRPKHAVFALHDAVLTGLQPDRLCSRDIFVWLPTYLPGAPDFFKCTCNGRLSLNGMFL